MDSPVPQDIPGHAESGDCADVVPEEVDQCREFLTEQLMWNLGCPPIVASGVMLRVAQALLYQFYLNGVCYLENFGTLRYVDGNIRLEPNETIRQNLQAMAGHRAADDMCLMGQEIAALSDEEFTEEEAKDADSRDGLGAT